VEIYLADKWDVPYFYTANRTIVAVGDSLTYGTGVDMGTQSWTAQIADAYGLTNVYVHNDGVAGSQLDAMDTRAATGIDILPYTGVPTTLVIWGGTNDIAVGGQSASNTYNRLRTFIQNRKATGLYRKIVVVTAIPRADTSTTTNMFAYNTLIRNNWTTLQADGADALVDLNTLAEFNADGDYNNTTYYNADKVHLTSTGYGVVATAIKAAIDALP
jgi:lysophospholipase L1-like esterase